MKNSYKFLFFFSLMIGTLISISANSWFSIWMGLEINLLSFIPLMLTMKNLFSSEASLKYFLTQALGSSILIFSILLFFISLNMKVYLENLLTSLICSTLMLKSGIAPFHFWFPSVMEGLNWNSNLILVSWQKIGPMMILSYCMNFYLLIFTIIMCTFFGSLGGLNQTSLRKLMAFSSINHMGWMMSSMLFNENLWIMYFIFYVFLTMNVIIIFNIFKLFNINQTFKFYNSNLFMKMSMFIVLLSLAGLPPFLGFFPKWMIIEMMAYMKIIFILLIMLFLTLISLFFYLRISYTAILFNHLNFNWNFKIIYNSKNTKILFFFTFIALFGLILINLIYF